LNEEHKNLLTAGGFYVSGDLKITRLHLKISNFQVIAMWPGLVVKSNNRVVRMDLVMPGAVRIGVISALQSSNVATEILEQIAHPSERENPLRNRRVFGKWQDEDGIKVCRGCIHFNKGWTSQLVLRIHLTKNPMREGLTLEEVPGKQRSLKDRNFVLYVGKNLTQGEIRHLANMIAACYITLGFGWKNRNGLVIPWPYGQDGRVGNRPSESQTVDVWENL